MKLLIIGFFRPCMSTFVRLHVCRTFAVRQPTSDGVNGTDFSDAKLDTRAARLRLKKRREPYWRSISEGLAVGYRKGAKAAPG